MASRTVALDEEAYGLLSAQKRPQESFSQTVKRLARPRKPISTFAGMWSDMTPKQLRELDRALREMRKADGRRSSLIASLWE